MLIRRSLKHLSRVNDVFLRRLRIERDITIFPDDTFLTSYPRSGNTWTRFLVGNIVHMEEAVTFLNVERLVPDMYKHSDSYLRHLPRPRVLKSHEVFDPRYRKIIYIVRDPRDVAVSNYHWEMKQRSVGEKCPIEAFVLRWMKGSYWDRLGNWGEHVASWLSTRQGHEGFLIVRYEDLIEDTASELAKIAGLLGIEATRERLTRAVELSSRDRMRELEARQGKKWVQTRYTRQDKPFVRRGSSGDWKSQLPPASVAEIERAWGDIMTSLGYERTSTDSSQPELEHARS
ncbi:MAG: sulfotransferase domain-containing protein [Acidobacteria bacterium]|nr:sulfotransferase domain-containing protein [Acidobacteriota bacterium]